MQNLSSKPRPAATVVVVREGNALPEVLMLRRHALAVFASHYVFPGGVVDTGDAIAGGRLRGRSSSEANELLGIESGGLGFFGAAIREAFEESAVLFAKRRDQRWAFEDDAISDDEISMFRSRLNDGSLLWSDFLQHHDFFPALDALHYIAYWVTPPGSTKRFSTRFFLGVMPQGQFAIHDDGELTDSCWMTAKDALQAGQTGKIKLMYPTYSTLSDIACYNSVDEIVKWARARTVSGEARLLPAFVEVDGVDEVVMPGSPHYPTVFDL